MKTAVLSPALCITMALENVTKKGRQENFESRPTACDLMVRHSNIVITTTMRFNKGSSYSNEKIKTEKSERKKTTLHLFIDREIHSQSMCSSCRVVQVHRLFGRHQISCRMFVSHFEVEHVKFY